LAGLDYALHIRSVSSVSLHMVGPIDRPSTNHGSQFKYLDIDGDGAMDVLAPYGTAGADRYDALHVRGNPAASHIEMTPLEIDIQQNNCDVFVDVNGDGLLDQVNVENGADVRLNRGDGRFTSSARWTSDFSGTKVCDEQVYATSLIPNWKQTAV